MRLHQGFLSTSGYALSHYNTVVVGPPNTGRTAKTLQFIRLTGTSSDDTSLEIRSREHAEAIIRTVPDPLAAAKRIVEEGLNVRQTEALAHEEGVPERKPQKARTGAKEKDPDTLDLERRVSDALGLKVAVNHRDPGGTVQINYRNLEQLDEARWDLRAKALEIRHPPGRFL